MLNDIEQTLLCDLPVALNAIRACAKAAEAALEGIPVRLFDLNALDSFETVETMVSVIQNYANKAKSLLPELQDAFETAEQKKLMESTRCEISFSVEKTVPAAKVNQIHSGKGAIVCAR